MQWLLAYSFVYLMLTCQIERLTGSRCKRLFQLNTKRRGLLLRLLCGLGTSPTVTVICYCQPFKFERLMARD